MERQNPLLNLADQIDKFVVLVEGETERGTNKKFCKLLNVRRDGKALVDNRESRIFAPTKILKIYKEVYSYE